MSYHYIRDPAAYAYPGIYALAPKAFARQIEDLKADFHIASPDEAEAFVLGSRDLQDPTGISILPAPDGTFIHPRAADPTKLSSSHNRPAPEAVTSAPADVQPTGAPTFRAFLRHRSTLVAFLRQAGFVALAARQPPGTGSAQILRSMSPNSRRVRCPSANRSQ